MYSYVCKGLRRFLCKLRHGVLGVLLRLAIPRARMLVETPPATRLCLSVSRKEFTWCLMLVRALFRLAGATCLNLARVCSTWRCSRTIITIISWGLLSLRLRSLTSCLWLCMGRWIWVLVPRRWWIVSSGVLSSRLMLSGFLIRWTLSLCGTSMSAWWWFILRAALLCSVGTGMCKSWTERRSNFPSMKRATRLESAWS